MGEEWDDDLDGYLSDEEESGESAMGLMRAPRTGPRPAIIPDPLYGSVRLSWWAAALVATPPFQRLAGISLSDVPGEWLFGRSFPSRLEHTFGVYHLARLARPRDRTLQVAALAHDLGHGPFSHLSESLMRERLGIGHETRSARLLEDVRRALAPAFARKLDWLDWDEAAALVEGGGVDGRGALLNGRLDYDNADNVARFLLASELGTPRYDPAALARALRPLPPPDQQEIASVNAVNGNGRHPGRLAEHPRAYLAAEAREAAEAWQEDRLAVYAFLHDGHQNVATHAMLRKAIDLAALTNLLPLASFFDLTDGEAHDLLCAAPDAGVVTLARAASEGRLYQCIWEARTPARHEGLRAALARWRDRLALEARLAGEAGLAEHEVVVEGVVSSGRRALPPIARLGRPNQLTWPPEPLPTPQTLHVFAAPGAPRDYIHRLRRAAERIFGAMGIAARQDDAIGSR